MFGCPYADTVLPLKSVLNALNASSATPICCGSANDFSNVVGEVSAYRKEAVVLLFFRTITACSDLWRYIIG